MIIFGIVMLIAAYLLPVLLPGIPFQVIHVMDVVGWIALVLGIILLVLALIGRPLGGVGPVRANGRRYWY